MSEHWAAIVSFCKFATQPDMAPFWLIIFVWCAVCVIGANLKKGGE